jgi:hypothetical protein
MNCIAGTDQKKSTSFDRESGAISWGFGWVWCDLSLQIVSLNSARVNFAERDLIS